MKYTEHYACTCHDIRRTDINSLRMWVIKSDCLMRVLRWLTSLTEPLMIPIERFTKEWTNIATFVRRSKKTFDGLMVDPKLSPAQLREVFDEIVRNRFAHLTQRHYCFWQERVVFSKHRTGRRFSVIEKAESNTASTISMWSADCSFRDEMPYDKGAVLDIGQSPPDW